MLRAPARWSLPTAHPTMASVVIATFAFVCSLAAVLLGLAASNVNAAPTQHSALSTQHLDIPPPLYLGLEAYRHWDKLSYLEIGDRIWGQTTADPAGTNADNTHIMRVLTDGQRVLLD